MRYFIIFILFSISLISCRTVKEYQYIEKRDTIVTVERDTAVSYIQLECDSDLNVVVKEVETQQGKRSHITPEIKSSGTTAQINIESVSEGLKIPLEAISETKKEVEIQYIDKPIPKYYKFCSWWLWISVGIILLFIAYKIIKIWI